MSRPHRFRAAAAHALADGALRAAVRKTTAVLEARRAAAVAAWPGFDALRAWGRDRKLAVSADLEGHAARFAERVEAAGGTVHRARDAAEARRIAVDLARTRGVAHAVKAKSMTAEEVGLNGALEAAGVPVTETDLGEFIIQLAGERPSHILAPAIHRSRAQVGALFAGALGARADLDVKGLVEVARRELRQRFLSAGLGITGANFAVAETGTLVLVTNEGNGRMVTSLPRVHLAVVGIDKLIPGLGDLPGFLALLTRSASGQVISSYVSLTTGPRRPGDGEGPSELHVILVDNGRTALAGGPLREVLHCLHCGSCLNHCPVYRAVGGHAYGSVYPGPMGSVLSPLLWGADAFPDLPHACTLCGRCAEVCPVRIPLPAYHRRLRERRSGSRVAGAAAAAAARPALYRAGLAGLRALLRSGAAPLVPEPDTGAVRAWTRCRRLPEPEPGPGFREWWAGRSPAPPAEPARAVEPAPEPGDGRPAGAGGDAPAVRPRGGAGSPVARYEASAASAGTEVARVAPEAFGGLLEAFVRDLGARTVAAPRAGWPAELAVAARAALERAGCRVVAPGPDGAWDRDALASADLGVTWCPAFVAETGSLAFPSGSGLGTLASLLPPVHLAVGWADAGVDDLAALLGKAALPARLVLVTGPSRTGDIEGTLTAGVHGPGRVVHWLL